MTSTCTSDQRKLQRAKTITIIVPQGVEDLPGYSVLFKSDSGQIFHTYSTYGGVEQFRGAYTFLDATIWPKREWTEP
jgi:predicted dithiol-disulfide oxidoreductase (DUF899 family)